MLNKKTLSTKLALFAMVILAGFLGEIKYKQWQSQKSIETERAKLQSQADELQKKNTELNDSLQYLNSPSFKERVARQQLGLKKEGENVYSFSDALVATPGEKLSAKESRNLNIQKWWDYFFSEQ